MTSYQFHLKGLGCANCANKMQEKISALDGVQNVQIDFLQENLRLESLTELTPSTIQQIQRIVDSVESGVQVVPVEPLNSMQLKTADALRVPWRIITALFLFIFSFFIQWQSPFDLFYFIATYWIIAYDIILKTLKMIVNRSWFDENFLMTLATVGAFAIGEYREAVAVMLFYQIGEYFQERAVNASRQSIQQIMTLRPDSAWVLNDHDWLAVHPQQVQVGQTILVKPGEKVPLDGEIIEGISSVDASALTGESLPRPVTLGDSIQSGLINLTSPIQIQVTKAFAQSTVNQIIDMVENASQKKASTEKFITQFARIYTPLVVGLAVLLALLPPLFFPHFSWQESFYRSLQFLVISCPCALVISIPLSFYGGIGSAAKQGILIKGGATIEKLIQLSSIAFDKTGTLTQGQFEIETIHCYQGLEEETVLDLLAHLEQHSSHPLAQSVVASHQTRGLLLQEERVQAIEEIAGQGIKGIVDHHTLYAGNRQLMQELNIPLPDQLPQSTLIYLANKHNLLGIVAFDDHLKIDAQSSIDQLRKLGIQNLAILSGDRQVTVDNIANKLGIHQAYGQLLPQDKMAHFNRIKENAQGTVAFIGDGINDAPVLALADIGISLGGISSDAALEAADLILMDDQLTRLPEAIRIARRTASIAKQNIIFAIGIKVLFLILASFGISNMWEAIIADVGVTILAVFNALRTLKKTTPS